MFDEMGEKKPHPQPLPEEGGEQLPLEIKLVVLLVIGGANTDDIERQNDLTKMSA